MRQIITLCAAAAAALAFAGCGANATTGSVPVARTIASTQQVQTTAAGAGQLQATPAGKVHPDTSCTPDSYGYCAVLVSQHGTRVICPGGANYTSYIIRYEVYQGTTDEGSYILSQSWDCPDGDYDYNWSPGEPSLQFGDPNLP